MVLRMPDYCRDFACIGEKCSDNCCIGWEIDIDDKTAAYYESVGGDFGARLRENISHDCPKSFILGKDERCPFLNGRNLCDIIITLGEDRLCSICTEHPRYYEWFDGVKEGGIGLCCEEAARIILSCKKPFSFWERELADEGFDDYDRELYGFFFGAREKILRHLQDRSIPFERGICDVLDYGEAVQSRADNGIFVLPEISESRSCEKSDLRDILSVIYGLEPIDEAWRPYLEKIISEYGRYTESPPEASEYQRNIAAYFVWRYFMKGVFDGEILSRIKLAAVSAAVVGYMLSCGGDFSLEKAAEAAKNYSKNIEYSEENMEALADAACFEAAFSTDSLKGLF